MYYTVCANNNYSMCCVIIEYLAYGEIMFYFIYYYYKWKRVDDSTNKIERKRKIIFFKGKT